MDDSRVKSVSQLLSAYFGENTLKEGEEYVRFKRAWVAIAGPRLGEHSWPADVRHGVLFVETEHSGWIQLLQMKQERILEEVSRRYPQLGVRTMAFRIASGERPAADPGRSALESGRRGAEPAKREAAPCRPDADAEMIEKEPDPGALPGGAGDALPEDIRAHFESIRGNIRGNGGGVRSACPEID